jgi:hypothetical protein
MCERCLARATLVIPGREEAPKAAYREPGISACSALNMSGFRVRVRQVPAAPRNDEKGGPASTAGLQPQTPCPHAISLKSNRNPPVAAGRGCDLT